MFCRKNKRVFVLVGERGFSASHFIEDSELPLIDIVNKFTDLDPSRLQVLVNGLPSPSSRVLNHGDTVQIIIPNEGN